MRYEQEKDGYEEEVEVPGERIVFIDGVDFQHELGHALGGNKVYAGLGDALMHNPCATSCGVVKCKVTLIEWMLPQDWKNAEYVTVSEEELKKDPDLQRLETYSGRLKWLEDESNKQKKKIEELQAKINDKTKVGPT